MTKKQLCVTVSLCLCDNHCEEGLGNNVDNSTYSDVTIVFINNENVQIILSSLCLNFLELKSSQ